MKFDGVLYPGTLIKRYSRFLADVTLEDGTKVTAHTANTGSMKGCNFPGSMVWLRDTGSPTRKYPLSWELVEVDAGIITGINTGLPNHLVKEGIESGIITELQGYDNIRREVTYGKERSRIDLYLESGSMPDCYVEVKSVTWVENGVALFPDAVSVRGSKHLRELTEMARQGYRAVIFFCIQRKDAQRLSPADQVDPEYGKTLRSAMEYGVEAIAYACRVSREEIVIQKNIPVICGVNSNSTNRNG